MSARGGQPFPSPGLALALAVLALFAIGGVSALGGPGATAYAFGAALGLGGIGTLAARYVPEPSALRLGLTPFPLRALPLVLLALPAVLLTSELDNWVRLALGAPPSDGLGTPQKFPVEAVLLTVLLLPTLREFFLRGLLLQGCVSALGRARGVLLVALIQALLFGDGDVSTPAGAVSALVQSFALGILLCALRLATGSILPGIALSSGMLALGVAATAFPDRVPIPGFNAPGATTPLAYLIPAAACVALGVALLAQQLAREPALPPIPPRAEDDEEAGGLF